MYNEWPNVNFNEETKWDESDEDWHKKDQSSSLHKVDEQDVPVLNKLEQIQERIEMLTDQSQVELNNVRREVKSLKQTLDNNRVKSTKSTKLMKKAKRKQETTPLSQPQLSKATVKPKANSWYPESQWPRCKKKPNHCHFPKNENSHQIWLNNPNCQRGQRFMSALS